MARYQITLSKSNWTGGTASFWFDPDVGTDGTAYDADTGGNAIASIAVPVRSGYTFLGFGLTSPSYRCIDEDGDILLGKIKELFDTSSTFVSGSVGTKTLTIFSIQDSTKHTARKIQIQNSYWKGAPQYIYYTPDTGRYSLDQAQTQYIDNIADTLPDQECWTFDGCFFGNSPTTISGTPAKSGDCYIDAAGGFTAELAIKASATAENTTLQIKPRGTYASYKVVLDPNGGTSGSVTQLYRKLNDSAHYYTHHLCGDASEAISLADIPAKDSCSFGGFCGTKVTNASQAATATYHIDKDGNLDATALSSLSFTASGRLLRALVYARWVPLCAVAVNKGENGTNAVLPYGTLYADTVHGGLYADTAMAQPVTAYAAADGALAKNECYVFAGVFDAADDSYTKMYFSYDGGIFDVLEPAEYTASLTVYCQWELRSRKLILDGAGGSGGPAALYVSLAGDAYADDLCEGDPANEIETPVRHGYLFRGYRSVNGSLILTCVNANGATNSPDLLRLAFSGTTPPTATAKAAWDTAYSVKIQINATGSTVGAANAETAQDGTAAVFFIAFDHQWFWDETCTDPINFTEERLSLPTCRCNRCIGLFSAKTGGTKMFDEYGNETGNEPSGSTVCYAQWERRSYAVDLDLNMGGAADTAGATRSIYHDGTTATFYLDDQLTEGGETVSVSVPSRPGYRLLGFYSHSTSAAAAKEIDYDGTIRASVSLGQTDSVWYARWDPIDYTLTLDYGEGSGSPESLTVHYGEKIGVGLPTPASIPGKAFAGWYVEGVKITAGSTWKWGSDKTAVALWLRGDSATLHEVTDWFDLAKTGLIPIYSDDGSNLPHVVCRDYGSWNGSDSTASKKWINPTVRYMVTSGITLSVALGAAYTASGDRTGYMIKEVDVDTGIRAFPVVTISAVANEGSPAINLFPVAMHIDGRARAQNLEINGSAPFGGLPPCARSCRVSVKCDPVVMAENGVPSASDVVNGVAEATVEAEVPDGSPAPTVNWRDMGTVTIGEGKRYRNIRIAARMDMVATRES